mmetsp:Transcript_27228/g.77904  ORF Transcript_27228/g.77904 Transcript_27228/m.77904 type:complete len:200 (+) Transcript_27228:2351-2950(+)
MNLVIFWMSSSETSVSSLDIRRISTLFSSVPKFFAERSAMHVMMFLLIHSLSFGNSFTTFIHMATERIWTSQSVPGTKLRPSSGHAMPRRRCSWKHWCCSKVSTTSPNSSTMSTVPEMMRMAQARLSGLLRFGSPAWSGVLPACKSIRCNIRAGALSSRKGHLTFDTSGPPFSMAFTAYCSKTAPSSGATSRAAKKPVL